MNMISTGAFLPEMDASNKQETTAEKFARVWEKKNAKAARAGGVSLMALSLAACGGSETPAVVVEEEEAEVEAPAVTTTSNTLAAAQDILTGDDFSAGADTVTGTDTTMTAVDVVVDATDGDGDTLTINAAGAVTTGTISGIENVVINSASAAALTHNLSGVATGTVTVNMTQLAGATSVAFTNVGTIGVTAGTGFSGNADSITVTQTEDATATITTTADVEALVYTATDAAAAGDEVATVVSAGDLDITSTVATTLNVSGTGDITLNAGSDSLAGATGTITGSAGQGLVAAVADDIDASVISGFDDVTIDTTTDTSSTFDARTIGGTLILADGAVAADVITIANGATVQMAGADDTTTLDVNDGATTNSTDNTANLIMAAASAGASGVTVEGTADVISTLNVSTSAATVDLAAFTITNAAALTANLSGAGDISLAKAGAGALTVDASGMTGDLSATSSATMLTITGGAGEDTITAATGVASVLDGGAGNDTLVTGVNADLTTATFTNFEVINGSSTVLSSQINGLTIIADDANLNDINITASGVDTNVINLSGITFLDTADGIDMTPVAGNATQLTTTITLNSAMTITGSNGADELLGFGGADTITGGGGADNISAAAGADTIDGGAGDDTLDGGTGADSITLGAGDDTINQAYGDGVAASAIADSAGVAHVAGDLLAAGDVITFANGADVISGFTAGAAGDLFTGLTTTGAATTAVGVAFDALVGGGADDLLFLSGAWNADAGTFTVAADGEGADSMILDVDQSDSESVLTSTGMFILTGVDTDNLVAADFT
jgi:hypothetical protein